MILPAPPEPHQAWSVYRSQRNDDDVMVQLIQFDENDEHGRVAGTRRFTFRHITSEAAFLALVVANAKDIVRELTVDSRIAGWLDQDWNQS